MSNILGNLSTGCKEFNLNKINIEDEGMEDLETFNKMYKVDNSKCSLFSEIKPVLNISSEFYLSDESNSNSSESGSHYGYNRKDLFFRVDFYLKRVIENMTKPNIKKLILELGTLSSNNMMILTRIQSIKAGWKKEKLVELAFNLLLELYFNKNN